MVMGDPGPTGRFGSMGGRFVPEALIPACEQVEEAFRMAWADAGFRAGLTHTLSSYAGRPTPVTAADRLSEALGVSVLLKREDLAHTGSHKINSVAGQVLLAQRMGKTAVIAETGAGQHGVATATVAAHARAEGRAILITYVTAGIRADWLDLLTVMIDAGADAVEIGMPFSDPMLDGPAIQQASSTAISRGTTMASTLAQLRDLKGLNTPLIAMSYANHAYTRGLRQYCHELAGCGVSGTIIPDLPASEADEYLAEARDAGLDAILMVTPATPDRQLRIIAERSRGFLYVMSVMNTTGQTYKRDDDARWAVAARSRKQSARPVIIGFGIDTAERAAAAAKYADGVIVASALMRRVMDGSPSAEIGHCVREIRTAIDNTR